VFYERDMGGVIPDWKKSSKIKLEWVNNKLKPNPKVFSNII